MNSTKPKQRCIRTDKAIQCCRQTVQNVVLEAVNTIGGFLGADVEQTRRDLPRDWHQDDRISLVVPLVPANPGEVIRPQWRYFGQEEYFRGEWRSAVRVLYAIPVLSYIFMLEGLAKTNAWSAALTIGGAFATIDEASTNDPCYVCNMRRSFPQTAYRERFNICDPFGNKIASINRRSRGLLLGSGSIQSDDPTTEAESGTLT